MTASLVLADTLNLRLRSNSDPSAIEILVRTVLGVRTRSGIASDLHTGTVHNARQPWSGQRIGLGGIQDLALFVRNFGLAVHARKL